MVTFEAGPDADNSIIVEFTLTDDDIALEAIESYVGTLDTVGNPEGVTIGMIATTTVNVEDDDGEFNNINFVCNCKLSLWFIKKTIHVFTCCT